MMARGFTNVTIKSPWYRGLGEEGAVLLLGQSTALLSDWPGGVE
jgi:hypothetical protein